VRGVRGVRILRRVRRDEGLMRRMNGVIKMDFEAANQRYGQVVVVKFQGCD
jgi:uncharacterized protein (UPF0262 family)